MRQEKNPRHNHASGLSQFLEGTELIIRTLDVDSHRMEFVGNTMARAPHEVNVISLLQRDRAPQQYPPVMRRTDYGEPERELMLAVLEDAIYCFQSYAWAQDSIRTRLFLQAKEWLMEDDDDQWLFSFTNICAVFGFSPHYIRAGLLRHKETESVKGSTARVYQFAARRVKKNRFSSRQSFCAHPSSPSPSTFVRV